MRASIKLLGLCCGIAMASLFAMCSVHADEARPPRVQLAILLDTSNSMDGLIDQAKTQLWRIVNQFITAKRDGKRPTLEVALYEYGKTSLPRQEGYVRLILPLTTDLDKISQELFALTTNGGDEYCGTVIEKAAEQLQWATSVADLKTIFIAGNEPFTQGKVDYKEACGAAIARGITVNTIFCGPYDEGVATNWQDGAKRADGSYMNIDQNRQVVHIQAPQDQEIVKLGELLNETYIPYGTKGEMGKANQEEQDKNALSSAPGVMTQRSSTKASCHYKNVGWDLVDALLEKRVKIEAMEDEDLPEEMRTMTLDERRAYVEAQITRRREIQQQIHELNEKRKEYVAEAMESRTDSGEDTFDAAIISMIREQAEKKNFLFE